MTAPAVELIEPPVFSVVVCHFGSTVQAWRSFRDGWRVTGSSAPFTWRVVQQYMRAARFHETYSPEVVDEAP